MILKYIIVDGGMSDNIRPMLYQAKYTAYVANKMDDSESSEGRDNRVTVKPVKCIIQ